MPKKTMNTDELLNRIEQLCDAHQAQVSISRAGGIWVGSIRTPDGRSMQHQSPDNQRQLLTDLVRGLEYLLAV